MKRATRDRILILIGDFVIALFAFGLLYYYGKLPHWYQPVLSALLWVILGVVTLKLRFYSYKRIRSAIGIIFLQTAIAGVLIFWLHKLCIPNYKYHYSLVVALIIIALLESLFYLILRKFVYRKIPYFYEEPDLADVEEIGVNSSHYEKEEQLNKDVENIIALIPQMPQKPEDIIDHIGAVKHLFSEDTLFLNTDNSNNIFSSKPVAPHLIVHLCSLNRVRHLNTLLAQTNLTLAEHGSIACHCLTSALHREKILRQSPPIINRILYALDYLWHRVCSKLPLLRSFYFCVTGGKSRVFTRVEILGRLYRAGFDVIHEEVHNGRFYVVARKVKEPIRDDKPSNGMLIRLRRHGKGGKIIGVYKFRTMHAYSEYLQPYIYRQQGLATGGKIQDDYRVSKLGKFLRKCWFDELPMFINFFKRDMKLVGVRPLSDHYFNLYDEDLKELRIKTKPGLLPPFYADIPTPKTLEEVQESERRYLNDYFKNPIRTDWSYFWKILRNIVLKGKRSG